MARFLLTLDDDELFAYTRGGHDFYRASDDTLWAHESDGWLLAARSGATLARGVDGIFWDPQENVPMYYLYP